MSDTPDAAGGDAVRCVPVASAESTTSVRAPGDLDASDGHSAGPGAEPASTGDPVRQAVVRVRGARRARLLAAPGTTAEPAPADDGERGASAKPVASGPNDDRMLREVPPHY